MSHEKYLKERDRCVIELDVKGARKVIIKYNPSAYVPAPEVVLVSLHKCRIAITSIDEELKNESRAWLKDNGYQETIQ